LILLVGLIVALTPMAYASPPDPSWIRGVYDGADFDDVVILLGSGVGVVDPFPLAAMAARPVKRGRIVPADAFCVATLDLAPDRSRAPPTS
jgi:hypothetical protein